MADPRVAAALEAYGKLLRAGRLVLARLEPRFNTAGLTATQFAVLEAILHKGPLSQRDVGRVVQTSAGNMTDLVDKLQARGLVHRARQRTDRRAVTVELTPAGRDLIDSLLPHYASDVSAAMIRLSDEELRRLSDLLSRLDRNDLGPS